MGCFIPIIPGPADPPSDTPASDGYDCFATPQSILGRAPSPVVAYATKTMSASASFIATASPAANAFVNYGCWQNTQVANLFDTVITADIAASSISVDTCVAFCDSNNHRFAAIYGLAPNSNCACGDTLKPDVTPNGAMEDCNQPCPGSAQQNCGGDNGPLVYARSDVTPNQWAQSYTATWSQTIRYSCQGGGGGGGGKYFNSGHSAHVPHLIYFPPIVTLPPLLYQGHSRREVGKGKQLQTIASYLAIAFSLSYALVHKRY